MFTCFITVDNDERSIRIAYYTVKEYIFSERVRSRPASDFYDTADSVCFLAAQNCIINIVQNFKIWLEECLYSLLKA